MPAIKISEETSVVDSGIGPIYVTETQYQDYDIDDFVHNSALSKALYLQMLNKAQVTDPDLAVGRPPVDLGGVTLGGHN